MINFIKLKINNIFSDQKFSEILTGSVWALGARILATGMGLVTSIIVARIYGAKVLGIVAVINSFLIMSTIFTVMGTNISILRLIPEHLIKYSPTSAFRVYRKTQHLVILLSVAKGSIFFLGANFIAIHVFHKPQFSFYFGIASIFIVFKSLTMFNTSAVRGLRLIRMFAIMQMLPHAFNLLLLVVFSFIIVRKDIPVYAQLLSFTLTSLFGWVIMECSFKKLLLPNDRICPIRIAEIISISFPMLMTSTMTFIIGQTGVVLLGMFRSEIEVGYYDIAVKLGTLTSFVLDAVNSMAAPKFSELFQRHKINELFYVAKKSSKLIFYTTTPLLLGLIVLGKYVLQFAFGVEFLVAYPALVLIVIGQFIHSISGATALFMDMTGNQKILNYIMLIAAGVNIILSIWLIPILDISGAAIAAMISLSGWNVVTLIYLKLKYGKTTGYFPMYAHS